MRYDSPVLELYAINLTSESNGEEITYLVIIFKAIHRKKLLFKKIILYKNMVFYILPHFIKIWSQGSIENT